MNTRWTVGVVLSAAVLTGCVSTYRTADISELSQIPDDCANKAMIINWLEFQIKIPKPITVREDIYEAQISALKTKLWRLHYICQPV